MLHHPKVIVIVVPKKRSERKRKLLYIACEAQFWESVWFVVLPKCDPSRSEVVFRFVHKIAF